MTISMAISNIPTNTIKKGLETNLENISVNCNSDPCKYNFSLTISNPTNEEYTIYFAQNKGDQIELIDELGIVLGTETKTMNIYLSSGFPWALSYTGKYVVLDSRLLSSKEFTIQENWIEYIAVILVPLLLIIGVLYLIITKIIIKK